MRLGERQCTYQDLRQAQLGDVLTLGVGMPLSVRAIEPALPMPVGTMTGFVLAGEVGPQAVLLSIPPSERDPVSVYTPLDHIPPSARTAVPVCQGVVLYWAPHLPNLAGSHGELGYKVAKVRGSVDPMVLIWRGRERVVFWRTSTLSLGDVRIASLPRDPSRTEAPQARYAAAVGAGAPELYPAPVLEPARRLTSPSRR